MKKHNWGVKFYIALIFLLTVVVLAVKAIIMLFRGEVETGSDSRALDILLAVLIMLPTLSYFSCAVKMLRHLIKFKTRALSITDRGVENTLVFCIVFAFIFVVPVKLMPWESVNYYNPDVGLCYIRVKSGLVKSSIFGRLILKVRGYLFGAGFIRPKVTPDEIAPYLYRFKCNKLTL